jgi:exodeoxyribonuclease-3
VASPLPVLLIGDYNVVATDGKGDIYSPASWKNDALLQPQSRDAYRRLLAQGWTDAIHSLHPGKPIYTFWDFFRDRFARDAGLRIDHLLLNAPAAARLKEAGVDKAVRAREKPSDHAPAWVVLD